MSGWCMCFVWSFICLYGRVNSHKAWYVVYIAHRLLYKHTEGFHKTQGMVNKVHSFCKIQWMVDKVKQQPHIKGPGVTWVTNIWLSVLSVCLSSYFLHYFLSSLPPPHIEDQTPPNLSHFLTDWRHPDGASQWHGSQDWWPVPSSSHPNQWRPASRLW